MKSQILHSKNRIQRCASSRLAPSRGLLGLGPLLLLGMALTLGAQTRVDLATQTKNADFSAFSVTKPLSVGPTLPSTCNTGQLYISTSPAANIYVCSATNLWTLPYISSDISASQTMSGSLAAPVVNGVYVANSFPGSDIGAQVNAAFAACNMNCKVQVLPGTYSFSTTILMNKPTQTLEGLGSKATVVLNYTGSGYAIEMQMDPFTSINAGMIANLTLTGTSSGLGGLLTGSVIGSVLRDIEIDGFPNGDCINIQNTSDSLGNGGWYERNHWYGVETGNAHAANPSGCLYNVYVKPTANGTSSLGYNDWQLQMNVANGQKGIYLDGSGTNVFWYNSRLLLTCNVTSSSTSTSSIPECLTITNNSIFTQSNGGLFGENSISNSAYGTGIHVLSGGTLNFEGEEDFINLNDLFDGGSMGGGIIKQFGPNPAQNGTIRLGNTGAIVWRNAANTGDVAGITVDSSNNLELGNGGNKVYLGGGTLMAPTYATSQVCATSASPAVCYSAAAGQVRVPTGATTLQVNTHAVTNSSSIGCLTYSTVAGSVPSNMNSLLTPYVSAVSAGTSFTLTLPVAPVGAPVNVQYCLIN